MMDADSKLRLFGSAVHREFRASLSTPVPDEEGQEGFFMCQGWLTCRSTGPSWTSMKGAWQCGQCSGQGSKVKQGNKGVL